MTPTLRDKLIQWRDTASVQLTHSEKRELSQIHFEKFKRRVNISCSSCIVDALNRLSKSIEVLPPPKQQELESLKMDELREIARSKGLPVKRSKAEIIDVIKSAK